MTVITPQAVPDVLLIEPKRFGDERGFFVETYRESFLAERGVSHPWVQDNHSRSSRGVLRGLHFSVAPGQAKLIRCARGAIRGPLGPIRVPTLYIWGDADDTVGRVAAEGTRDFIAAPYQFEVLPGVGVCLGEAGGQLGADRAE